MTFSIKELKNYLRSELSNTYPKEELEQVIFIITGHITGYNRAEQVLQASEKLDENTPGRVEKIISRLKKQEPVQYVLGSTEFYGFPFYVSKGVLIPRRETEELVRWVSEVLQREEEKTSLLDIGTGSGCIAISLKKLFPRLKVQAWDVSGEALSVAKNNAKLNNVTVEFENKDILEEATDKKFDVIVSNPPYVLESDKKQMNRNVLAYEPGEALFVPDDEALKFYHAIAVFASSNLKEKGTLFLEIHEEKGNEIEGLLKKYGFSEIDLKKDMQGKPRMVRGRMS